VATSRTMIVTLMWLAVGLVPIPTRAGGASAVVSPDGELRATVTQAGSYEHEHAIRVEDAAGHRIWSWSFGSADGNHGLTIEVVRWSPDSGFLVFNGTDSGGHSPWRKPTYFWSRRTKALYDVDSDSCVGPVAPSVQFVINAPDTLVVRTVVLPLRPEGADRTQLVARRLSQLERSCRHE
jgi:hypothetical protein